MNENNDSGLDRPRAADDALRIRRAGTSDAPALRALHELSLSVLSGDVYTPELVHGLLKTVDTAPLDMIRAGRLLLAERHGFIVGSAGWEPRVEDGRVAAHMRSVFVHPLQTRRGVATALLRAVEDSALGFPGVAILTLASTLNAVPLYEALGYRAQGSANIDLGSGLGFLVVPMAREPERPALCA